MQTGNVSLLGGGVIVTTSEYSGCSDIAENIMTVECWQFVCVIEAARRVDCCFSCVHSHSA